MYLVKMEKIDSELIELESSSVMKGILRQLTECGSFEKKTVLIINELDYY